MIIQCGGCRTKYKIDDSKVPKGGLKISCKKCNKIISVMAGKEVGRQKGKDSGVLENIVSKTGDLPPMPHIAMKVLELVQGINTTNEDLRKLISQDQSLTAQILKFSNSSMYSCARAIESLSDALVVLGYNTLKSLVITSSTQAVYKRKKVGLMEKKLWEHSVVTAVSARTIGEFIRFPKCDEAFTGGLLHDIGKVILSQGIPEEYNTIVQSVYNSEEFFTTAETDMLKFDHTDVGYLVVKKWNFALALEEAIHYHHNIYQASPESMTLVSIINLSDNIANKNGFGFEGAVANVPLESLASSKHLKLDKEKVEKLENKITSTIEADKDMISL